MATVSHPLKSKIRVVGVVEAGYGHE
uniref:Uncharacterized protein n=1 Tax=Vitis vinifera TaxID=29760 RepID=F6HWK1_VITVI